MEIHICPDCIRRILEHDEVRKALIGQIRSRKNKVLRKLQKKKVMKTISVR